MCFYFFFQQKISEHLYLGQNWICILRSIKKLRSSFQARKHVFLRSPRLSGIQFQLKSWAENNKNIMDDLNFPPGINNKSSLSKMINHKSKQEFLGHKFLLWSVSMPIIDLDVSKVFDWVISIYFISPLHVFQWQSYRLHREK